MQLCRERDSYLNLFRLDIFCLFLLCFYNLLSLCRFYCLGFLLLALSFLPLFLLLHKFSLNRSVFKQFCSPFGNRSLFLCFLLFLFRFLDLRLL